MTIFIVFPSLYNSVLYVLKLHFYCILDIVRSLVILFVLHSVLSVLHAVCYIERL